MEWLPGNTDLLNNQVDSEALTDNAHLAGVNDSMHNKITICHDADAGDRNEVATKFHSYVSAHPASRNDKANPRILGKYRQELFCSFWRNWYCASPYRLLQYHGAVCSFEADYTAHSRDRVDDEPYLSQLSPDSPLREMSLSLPIIFSRKRVLLALGKIAQSKPGQKTVF